MNNENREIFATTANVVTAAATVNNSLTANSTTTVNDLTAPVDVIAETAESQHNFYLNVNHEQTTGDEPSDKTIDSWREAAVEQFRTMLNELDEAEWLELQNSNNSPEAAPDLFSLYGELEALRQEVKIYSRTAAKTGESAVQKIEDLKLSLTEQSKLLNGAVIRIQSEIPKARHDAQKNIIMELIRISEAIVETITATQNSKLSPLAKIFGATQVINEIKKSQKMLIDKTGDVLRRLNLLPTAAVGDQFNAKTMRVVSTSTTGSQPTATVVAIFCQGYKYNDEIIQIAEVEIKE